MFRYATGKSFGRISGALHEVVQDLQSSGAISPDVRSVPYLPGGDRKPLIKQVVPADVYARTRVRNKSADLPLRGFFDLLRDVYPELGQSYDDAKLVYAVSRPVARSEGSLISATLDMDTHSRVAEERHKVLKAVRLQLGITDEELRTIPSGGPDLKIPVAYIGGLTISGSNDPVVEAIQDILPLPVVLDPVRFDPDL